MSEKIVLLPGDGVGPEVVSATVLALETLDLGLEFVTMPVGLGCHEDCGEYLPTETMEAVGEADAVLAGCVEHPASRKGYRNPLDDIKHHLNLFADVRIVGKATPKSVIAGVSMTFVTENPFVESSMGEVESVEEIVVERRVNYDLCKRLTSFARGHAEKYGRGNVICVHRADVYKLSGSLLRNTFTEVMEGSQISHETMEADRAAYEIVTNPSRFDVIVTFSAHGDLLLGEASALAGGMHFVPSASVGPNSAMFQPMHGPLPELMGKNTVNPTASILSGAMMLEYLGYPGKSEKLVDAVRSAYKRGYATPEAGGKLGTYEFAQRIVELLSVGN